MHSDALTHTCIVFSDIVAARGAPCNVTTHTGVAVYHSSALAVYYQFPSMNASGSASVPTRYTPVNYTIQLASDPSFGDGTISAVVVVPPAASLSASGLTLPSGVAPSSWVFVVGSLNVSSVYFARVAAAPPV